MSRNVFPRSRRIYRVLLRLYPQNVRHLYGREMEQVFVDGLQLEIGRRGKWVVPLLLVAASIDVVAHAVHRRWLMRRDRRGRAGSGRLGGVMTTLLREVKQALRGLARQPVFAGVVTIIVAVGIAGNAAIFSVLNAVLLAPLPFHESDELVTLDALSHNGFYVSLSVPNYMDWSERNRVFESFGASTGWSMTLSGRGPAEVLGGRLVMGDFFRTLGVDPYHGRLFTGQETLPGATGTAVLGHRYWSARLGGDAAVIGQTLTLDGRPYEIIGILPPEFGYPAIPSDVYVPMGAIADQLPWESRQSGFGQRAVARLAEGVSMESAQADMDRVSRELQEEFGPTVPTAELRSFTEYYVGDVRQQIWILTGAVAFVLLIAIVNVGNLLMVRGEDRRAEFAVRTALGASRGAVVRQFLVEGVVLSVWGGLIGLALAYGLLGVLVPLLPDTTPVTLVERIGVDASVLLFTAGIAVLSGFAFGLLPALRIANQSLLSELRGTRGTTDRKGLRVRTALVVTEVALATVLLIGAGLMVRTLNQLQNVDKGFSSDNILTARTDKAFADATDWRGFYQGLLARAGELPGVRSAAATLLVPLADRSWEYRVLPDHVPWVEEDAPSVLYGLVSRDYFDVLEIPVLMGRTFDESDRPGSDPVAVIDETMAERFWPGEDPIGKRISFNRAPGWTPENPVREYHTVIGVVKNVRHYELWTPSRIQVYASFEQTRRWGLGMFVMLKTDVPPTSLAAPLRRELAQIDADAPLYLPRTLDDYVDAELSGSRAVGSVLVVFGATALLLAGMGIFGVISYSVARRTKEIGVRLALGATGAHVVRGIARHGLAMSAMGVVVGLVAAAALTRLLTSQLFGVSPLEPTLYAGLALFLLLVAAVASYVPARRATTVDPVTALRDE